MGPWRSVGTRWGNGPVRHGRGRLLSLLVAGFVIAASVGRWHALPEFGSDGAPGVGAAAYPEDAREAALRSVVSARYVRAALQAGEMCATDSVIWVAANAGRVVHISSVDEFLTETPTCRYRCGGLCPSDPVQRVFLMGPYGDAGDARRALCGAITDWGRSPISSPCPYWVKIGGNDYRMTTSPSSLCDRGPAPTPAGGVPVPTGSHGEGRCVAIPSSPTPNYSPTPTPTPTPTAIVLRGRAFVDPPLARRMPLVDVPVILSDDGNDIDRTITRGPDGGFEFAEVPRSEDIALTVELSNERTAGGAPPWYQVRYERPDGPLVWMRTAPFDTRRVASPMTRDLRLSGYEQPRPEVPTALEGTRGRLDDLAVIYVHTHQAWQLVAGLGQRLDYDLPISIVGFEPDEDGAYWSGRDSSGAGDGIDPYIAFGAEDGTSSVVDGGRPDNREWHEFGHHVMADAYFDRMPDDDGNNHGGYGNPSTTDSWVEGFAEFFSMLVAREITRDPAPWQYRWAGAETNLEYNYKAWSPDLTDVAVGADVDPNLEEFAVAGLLWDLVDAADAADLSRLSDGSEFHDCVQVPLDGQLWALLTFEWSRAGVTSSNAPDGFGHLFDVKHLYDALRHENVGTGDSHGGPLSDLDELFVMHGFFADLDGDLAWDPGEEIGRAAYGARPGRRSLPIRPGSFLAVSAVDDATGAPIDVATLGFDVDVRFEPPFDYFDYGFQASVHPVSGRLYFAGQDAGAPATTIVHARGGGWESVAPYELTNREYWERMGQRPQQYFAEHTFRMRRTPTYLPRLSTGRRVAHDALASLPTLLGRGSSDGPGHEPVSFRSRPSRGYQGIGAAPQAPRVACGSQPATATATDGPGPTSTARATPPSPPTSTVHATSTGTPGPTATGTATRATATTTGTPPATWTPVPTDRATATGTSGPSPSATRTVTPGPSPTPTATATATRSPSTPPAPVVLEVQPAAVVQGRDVRVTVYGWSFVPGSVVTIGGVPLVDLEYPGPEPAAPNRDRIIGTLLAGLTPGVYDVVVVNPSGPAGRLSAAFAVRAPTPIPSPTPSSVAYLERVFTSSPNNDWQSAFASLEELKLWMEIRNPTGAPRSVRAEWEVLGPSGFTVPGLQRVENIEVDPATTNWRLLATLPTDLPVGEYRYTGTVRDGNAVSRRDTRFVVGHRQQIAHTFEEPTDGWTEGRREGGRYTVADGHYEILVEPVDRVMWSVPRDANAEEWAVEVTGWRIEGSEGTYGLVLGLNGDSTENYTFRVDESGRYAVHSVQRDDAGTDWTSLVDWTLHDAIRTGPRINHLVAMYRDGGFAFYINGERVVELADVSPAFETRQGVIAGTKNEADVLHGFDNFRLYAIEPGVP